MRISLVSFNAHTLNDSDLRSAILTAPQSAAIPVFIEQAKADPTYAGTYSVDVRNVAVGIHVLDHADRYAWRRTLNEWFARGTAGTLVATLEDGENYQLNCVVVSFTQDKDYPQFFTAILQAPESTWRAASVSTETTWEVDTSGDEVVVAVDGTAETRLVAAITPTGSPSGGYLYQDLYQLVNATGVAYSRLSWCIEIDTATLVTASKMQADCDDLRVIVNDQEVRRWIADPNDAATKVWFNIDLAPGFALELGTAVADSGEVGELTFKSTSNNKKAFSSLPSAGILYHGTEWFQYSGKDTKTLRVNVVTRGALGTTLQAHSASDTFYYIENVVYVVYGNDAATDPADDDDDYDLEKPVFNLSDSDNESWVYDDTTLFYDLTNPARPGTWTPYIAMNNLDSILYMITENGASGDPAMGMLFKCWLKSARWQTASGTLAWQFYHPAGIDDIDMTGQKYRSESSSYWPSVTGLQKSYNGRSWKTVFDEAYPVSEDTWTAITQSAQDCSDYQWARFVVYGSLKAIADGEAALEVLTATVNFNTTNLPSGTMLGENDNYPLDIYLENETTGDKIRLTYPMQLDKTLTVDGENYTVDVDGVNAHGALVLDDESRDVWIRLQPGNNTLKITAEEMGELDVDLSYYARMR